MDMINIVCLPYNIMTLKLLLQDTEMYVTMDGLI